mmetsp:Transcript_16575/g.39338  ORF Transcript_16575/g.39338 Transcript_16575/m.39338 type:complete len:451 (-) Transcript_16575:263-1615(-)
MALRSKKATVDSTQDKQTKLREYRELAKDIVLRAAEQHRLASFEKARKLYQMGLEVCHEALSLEVPNPGISTSNVGSWRSDLVRWREAMGEYLSQDNPRDPVPASLVDPKGSGAAAPRRPAAVKRAAGELGLSAAAPGHATPPVPPKVAAPRGEEQKLREMILSEVMESRPSVGWDSIAGLGGAKRALQELVVLPALRSDLFKGIRSPAKGLLLYGPPGNGKTLLARALANESKCTFFALSASSLTSRWMGEGEKLVRTLFSVAREMAPSVIFIDEIDSILSARSSGEHEASRRLKTEFLLQFDGVSGQDAHVVVIGATNRPQELDDAVRRRLEQRIFIPLPDTEGRAALLRKLIRSPEAKASLSESAVEEVARATYGFSGADLAALCREAAMMPLRELGDKVATVRASDIRPISLRDFRAALRVVKPSVDPSQLEEYRSWTAAFGRVGT